MGGPILGTLTTHATTAAGARRIAGFSRSVVGYSVDIALSFCALPGRDFSPGRTFSWRSEKEHLLDRLDEGGFPAWPAIERAIPGVRYHGHVPLERLWRRTAVVRSFLPSRG